MDRKPFLFLHVCVIEDFMFQVDEGAPSRIERLRA